MNNRHHKEKKQRTQYESRINRRYKDSLFRKVFSNKKDLLDLYNALNGTDYSNEEELTVTTLEDVVYISVKNDLSFLVGGTINLYEHQSSYNPNMPVRGTDVFCKTISGVYRQQRDQCVQHSPETSSGPGFYRIL